MSSAYVSVKLAHVSKTSALLNPMLAYTAMLSFKFSAEIICACNKDSFNEYSLLLTSQEVVFLWEIRLDLP